MGKPNMKTLIRTWDDSLARCDKLRQLVHHDLSKEEVAEQFRLLRLAKGYSEEDACRKLGFTARTIREWETGKRKNRVHFLNFWSLLHTKSRKPKTRSKVST